MNAVPESRQSCDGRSRLVRAVTIKERKNWRKRL
jgi:hypothetical protein